MESKIYLEFLERNASERLFCRASAFHFLLSWWCFPSVPRFQYSPAQRCAGISWDLHLFERLWVPCFPRSRIPWRRLSLNLCLFLVRGRSVFGASLSAAGLREASSGNPSTRHRLCQSPSLVVAPLHILGFIWNLKYLTGGKGFCLSSWQWASTLLTKWTFQEMWLKIYLLSTSKKKCNNKGSRAGRQMYWSPLCVGRLASCVDYSRWVFAFLFCRFKKNLRAFYFVHPTFRSKVKSHPHEKSVVGCCTFQTIINHYGVFFFLFSFCLFFS